MKFYHSIRFRIVAGILLFGILLITLNSATIFFVMKQGMSRMIDNLIATEADYYLYKYEKDKTTPLPHSKYINVHKGVESLPDRIKERVKGLPPGIYSLAPGKNKRGPLHVGVMELPDHSGPYYMIFHGREFFKENALLKPKEILFIFLALLLIPGIIAGYFISHALFKPVEKLMHQVRDLDPENLQTQFSHKQAENEIGMLSRTIDTAMNRIRDFIEREKQFTRDASHELRTPLTIVSGAVEIMEQQPEVEANPMLSKPLKRISRSIKDMQTTIETFLWLAREESGLTETSRVEPMIEKAIQDNEYLMAGKNIDLQVNIIQDKRVDVKEEIVYITVTNLIRNAFQFTAKGSVNVTLKEDRFSIKDTGTGIGKENIDSIIQPHIKDKTSQGFGLGLSIVSRLCSRFGWDLIIDSEPGSGTEVTILWND